MADSVTKTITKKEVRDGKLYYTYTETHTEATDQNKTEEGSVDIVASLTATACDPWSTEAESAGLNLTGSATQEYTTAKEYIFGSNRGDNKANANLTLSYEVTHLEHSETLTVTGKVTGAVAKTANNATSNTYTFTAKLLADDVEVKTATATVVETLTGVEVTYDIEVKETDLSTSKVTSRGKFKVSTVDDVTEITTEDGEVLVKVTTKPEEAIKLLLGQMFRFTNRSVNEKGQIEQYYSTEVVE